jgi:hypothetical protein
MTLSLLGAAILSNFAHVRWPELVQAALGEKASTTTTVLAELRQGEALGLLPRVNWRWLPVLALAAAEQALAGQYQGILDAGEAECLAAAAPTKPASESPTCSGVAGLRNCARPLLPFAPMPFGQAPRQHPRQRQSRLGGILTGRPNKLISTVWSLSCKQTRVGLCPTVG